ncbi:ankyrin repeat domain-containing protein [Legionella sp. W05-934-2]|uniref:ankyrin repeat domain-containing protein n=1 Tax=Legionella sp. W05-934-2 TaxID=1198649 RepID=UPI003462B215
MTNPTKDLKTLINEFSHERIELSGFKQGAMQLVQDGADLTVTGSSGSYNTLLHCLVLSNIDGVNDKEITELLTLKKDTVDAKNAYGRTTLTSLINQFQNEKYSLDDFKRSAMLLAKHGADLTVTGSSGSYNTLLHCLVLSNIDGVNDKEITELLTLKKDTVDAKSAYGRTTLTSLINQFQNEECSLDDFKRSAMLLAKHGADLTVTGSSGSYNTLLHCLVLSNKDEVNDKEISELVKLKTDLFNVEDGYGHLPIQSLLIKQPTTSIESVKKLINVGNALKYTNNRGENLLHTSSKIGNLELAKYLANEGTDITSKTKEAETPLHFSASSQNPALWQWLFENKVAIDAQDSTKRTALHYAVLKDNISMVQWLIDHNVDLYIQESNGSTALSLAKQYNRKEIISLLLKAEENPKGRLFSTIRALKEYGANLKTQGASKGQIAIDLAEELWSKADAFFKKENNPDNFKTFQTEFSQVLNSKNHEMSEYRTSWPTIIANIAIALTGIGALLLAGNLIYTKETQGRALFFFQKSQTTCEEKIGNVNQAVMGLGS